MVVDWKDVTRRLHSYPTGVIRLLPPCSQRRFSLAESQLGPIPSELIGMLRIFNGAELFIKALPLVTLFGLSCGERPDSDWAPGWYVDKVTPEWRALTKNARHWVIGMMNYGGLIILSDDGLVREWDTATNGWNTESWYFYEWIETTLREGDEYMRAS